MNQRRSAPALLHPLARLLAFCVLMMTVFAGGAARANNIDAQLVATNAAPGEMATLAIAMDPADGWHGYWSNPGDAGFGMTLDWSLPDGVTVGEPEYPVPDTLLIGGLMNHVYKGAYAVLVPIAVAETVPVGTRVPIAVDARWLACTDTICVPEQAVLRTVLTITRQAAEDSRLSEWRAALPASLTYKGRYEIVDGGMRVAVPVATAARLSDPHLFVGSDGLIDYAAPQTFSRNGNWVVVEAEARENAAAGDAVQAVLRLNDGRGLSVQLEPGAVPAANAPLSFRPGGRDWPDPGLALLLLGAFAGGLLLNIMPCVFPVLSLKAVALARVGSVNGDAGAHARTEALSYTAGVMVAVLALGGVLLALRAAGQEVGWAFQLQEPATIVLLFLLIVAITANLAGLFEMMLPVSVERRGGGAFGTGVLAAFVATPCTGPFMAGAMGAALLLPAWQALCLFAALGLGLALPFLALGFIPRLRAMMPRPGNWMNAFRRAMALPMGLTALALFWLCWRTGGWPLALSALIAGTIVLALLAVAGRRQAAGRSGARVAVLAAMVAVVSVGVAALMHSAPAASATALPGTVDFSRQALAEARQSRRPVFVYFTADWCVTCKVNEQVAIERTSVAAAFEDAGVVVLRGDWTRRDAAIARFLRENGAAGVPLYLWYAPGEEARTLPQVLTQSMLVDLAKP